MQFPPLEMVQGEWDWQPRYNGSYETLIESTGLEILVHVADADYQGDSLMLVRDGDKYGQLNFGWGSCSGCDAFQACDTEEEFDELRHSLVDGIIWDSLNHTVLSILNRDWTTSYFRDSLGERFANEVSAYYLAN